MAAVALRPPQVYSGGLGSYALLVMVAAFLQLHPSRQPPGGPGGGGGGRREGMDRCAVDESALGHIDSSAAGLLLIPPTPPHLPHLCCRAASAHRFGSGGSRGKGGAGGQPALESSLGVLLLDFFRLYGRALNNVEVCCGGREGRRGVRQWNGGAPRSICGVELWGSGVCVWACSSDAVVRPHAPLRTVACSSTRPTCPVRHDALAAPALMCFMLACLHVQVGVSCRRGGSFFNKRSKGFLQVCGGGGAGGVRCCAGWAESADWAGNEALMGWLHRQSF